MWHELSWNDANEAHIARHGVTPDEVHQVLDSDPRIYRAGRDYVVTARDMTAEEKTTFQRKTSS